MKLDAATFCLQWATGGLFFTWITTRRREVGLGYGWLLRIVYALLALAGMLLFATKQDGVALAVCIAASAAVVVAATVALVVSLVRRSGGVSGQRALRAGRRERVSAMVGSADTARDELPGGAEFPPGLDLVAPIFGFVGILAAAELAGGGYLLGASRLVLGALLIGAVTDAMLLGHWYLVQPGLPRAPLEQLVVLAAIVWPLHVLVMLVSPGMVDVLTGSIDDGSNGLLGWVWWACAFATIALLGVTWAALRERYYSAVMSATGLLYLAILTAFGEDLVARAVLSP